MGPHRYSSYSALNGQVDADVLAAVSAAGLAGPRAGHMSVALVTVPGGEALEDPDVGRVAGAEIIGVDDDQLGLAVVAEPLGKVGLTHCCVASCDAARRHPLRPGRGRSEAICS